MARDPFVEEYQKGMAAVRKSRPKKRKLSLGKAAEKRDTFRDELSVEKYQQERNPQKQGSGSLKAGYDPVTDRAIRGIGELFGNPGLERNLRAVDENLIGGAAAENAAFNIGRGEGTGWDALDLAVAAPLAGAMAEPVGMAARGVKAAARPATEALGSLAARVGASRPAQYLREARPLVDEAPRPVYIRSEEGPHLIVRRTDLKPQKQLDAARAQSINDLRAEIRDPAKNPALAVANEASMKARGVPLSPDEPLPITSLARQAGIGRAFREAVEGSPQYKSAVFERYGEMMPQIVEQAKAQNYDQLTEAAYRALGEDVKRQFDQLPVSMRYHHGDAEYPTPSAMFRDVLGEGNLNVFRGGDPHDFLSEIDPATGLSLNEEFRAVHDLIGHAATGSTFRPGGEEIAYATHARTLSPLAQLALLAETRGQNSFVNYSPLNADIIGKSRELRALAQEREVADKWLADPLNRGSRWYEEAKAASADLPPREEINAQLRELGAQTRFADQSAVLLPPEYLDPMTAGGMPDWLRQQLSVRDATNNVRGVHFSKAPGLTATDPARYGSGAFSGERAMVKREGLPDRTYFYSGPEGTVNPEESVGRVAPHVYEANLNGLYDVNADPEGLVRLAKAYNLTDYKPVLPEGLDYMGLPQPGSAAADMERLIRDYGYDGFLSDMGSRRAAAVYGPVEGLRPISRKERGYAVGGRV